MNKVSGLEKILKIKYENSIKLLEQTGFPSSLGKSNITTPELVSKMQLKLNENGVGVGHLVSDLETTNSANFSPDCKKRCLDNSISNHGNSNHSNNSISSTTVSNNQHVINPRSSDHSLANQSTVHRSRDHSLANPIISSSLCSEVQNFMTNVNITVSDYISQQYLVRGSQNYKVLKDKIREYCLSLKPSGMKDDTSCRVLYLVYQSLPELQRTDEADAIIRKMIGKHIRNAKYRAKCKLREYNMGEVDRNASLLNCKTEAPEVMSQGILDKYDITNQRSRDQSLANQSTVYRSRDHKRPIQLLYTTNTSAKGRENSSNYTGHVTSNYGNSDVSQQAEPNTQQLSDSNNSNNSNNLGNNSNLGNNLHHSSGAACTNQSTVYRSRDHSLANQSGAGPVLNNVCEHRLKYIAGATYSCVNCNDYFERLPRQLLVCEVCQQRFSHAHLLMQHTSEVHLSTGQEV